MTNKGRINRSPCNSDFEKNVPKISKKTLKTKTTVNKWLTHIKSREETENTKDVQNLH